MQKTDLNVSPYYDDFTEGSNFHRVLFRPAYSVQARELTQMQSILQNQIERLGSHFFKEGAVVIPGQVGLDLTYSYVTLQTNFTDSQSVEHTIENYRTSLVGHVLTGVTSGVKAKVVGTAAAVSADSEDLTLFVKYEQSGTDSGSTTKFTFDNAESITSDTSFSYMDGDTSRTIAADNPIATTSAASAAGTGCSASVQKGVYYIRGHFVECSTQTIVLDKYTALPSYRIGFTVAESLSTPEEDSSLLDNATGSTNYAAKGAHRLKYALSLVKKALGTADDADFVELMTVSNGIVQSKVRSTEYSILEETMARRTFDESGNYIVRGFDIDMREHYDDGLNNGLYTDASVGDASKVAITLSPGKAYVRGYEIETLAQTVVPLDKARSSAFTQNQATTFSAGNYLQVENTYGTPDIDSQTGISPFKEVQLRKYRKSRTHIAGGSNITNSTLDIPIYDNQNWPMSGGFVVLIDDELILCDGLEACSISGITSQIDVNSSGRGYLGTDAAAHDYDTPIYIWKQSDGRMTYPTTQNTVLGLARTRAFEHNTGVNDSDYINGAFNPTTSRHQHYLFDVRMLCKLTIMGDSSTGNPGFTSTKFLTNGAKITGAISGATGIVYIPPQSETFSLVDDAAMPTAAGSSTAYVSIGAGAPNSNLTVTGSVNSTGGFEVGMGITDITNNDFNTIPENTYITEVSLTAITLNQPHLNPTGNSQQFIALKVGNTDGSGEGKKYVRGLTFHVIQTTGTFTSNEAFTSNITGDLVGGATFGDAPIYYKMGDVHEVFSPGAANEEYWANVYPADRKELKGTVSCSAVGITAGSDILSGTNTGFTSDLKVGDLIEVEDSDGNVKRSEVRTISSDNSVQLVESYIATIDSSIITRVRSKLEEQEELVMISKLPKFATKTLKSSSLNNLSDTTLKVRRQSILDITGGYAANLTLPEGESFDDFSVDNYQLSVVDGTSSDYPIGTVLAPETIGSGCVLTFPDTRTLTVTLPSTGAKLKVTYTVIIAAAQEKTKTLIPMTTKAFTNLSGQIFGTNVQDEEICLGVADIFKVRAIYESTAIGTPAVPPTATYKRGKLTTDTSDTVEGDLFAAGEKITGSNGAIARVIDGTYDGASYGSSGSTFSFSYITTKKFTTGTTLTNAQNLTMPDLVITDLGSEDESTDILSNYQVDTGMRDTFYDLGRISRKPSAAPPTGQLLIVFDYFTHGAGNFFSVDSYPVGTSRTSITYGEIPIYSAQRVDPDTISPTGEYELRDALDFRPRVSDYSDSGAVSASKSVTPFAFEHRSFTGTGGSLTDIPKVDASFSTSFDHYLPQNSALYLDSEGTFRTISGAAADNPEEPSTIADAMKLAEFRLPQYTFDPLDIGVRKMKHRRYTMKDIGNLDSRISNVEYYTQLNMLEKDTKAYQIQDADGLDRFKNGFVVDNFAGHGTGDALHPDYKNSMDMGNGMLRPEFFHRALALEESVSTDALRLASGYQKTGDLITLPYSEVVFATQPYASRVENVNPFNVIAWVGAIDLDPASDIWRDTNRLPNLIINREGNYDTFIARNGGSAINTVWNEWETFWTGEVTKKHIWRDSSWATARRQVPYRRIMERTTTTVEERQSRTGVRTEITPRIDYESKGDRVVSVDILPFIRSKSVGFVGRVFKPFTRLFSFFDGIDVGEYVTPDIPYINIQSPLTTALTGGATIANTGTGVTIGVNPSTKGFASTGSITIDSTVYSYSDVTSTGFTISGTPTIPSGGHSTSAVVYKTPAAGDPLLTSAGGKVTGTFAIPDPNISGNPAFKVGERVFKLTSDSANGTLQGDTQTMGESTYYAKGLLDNIQETIIATRNADVRSNTVNSNRTNVLSTRISDQQVGWWDPLAQSFLVDTEGGAYLTSIDCYFNSKSATIPVQCQIRTMVNGYPSATILPFGTAVLDPSDVYISDDATTSTKFTFPSPVYLMQDTEYCFVIMANTQDYTMWLSHMGELDIGGSRMISDQPYAGVLFKSQNASTWTASQMEDLKFGINRASFTTANGTVTLQNQTLDTCTLGANPITTINGTTKIKVHHPNHGMYSAAYNYVKLSGLLGSVATVANSPKNLSSLGEFTKDAILEVGIDHYVIDVGGVGSFGSDNFAETKVTGGSAVKATENYMMDTGKVVLQTIELSGTDITSKIRTTTGTSPSRSTTSVTGGIETSFSLASWSNAQEVTLNENLTFSDPVLIASGVNETNTALATNKSFQTLLTLSSEKENISPVIDTQRMGIIAVQNRINRVDALNDLYSTDINSDSILSSQYKDSTVSEGDNNAAVYMTRKVTLENAAAALKVIFDAVLFSSATLKVYYKILQADDATQFEDLDWNPMTIDKSVSESQGYLDFREYAYEASGLNSYIAFSIKIVMQGTKTTEIPLIRDFRAIALAL